MTPQDDEERREAPLDDGFLRWIVDHAGQYDDLSRTLASSLIASRALLAKCREALGHAEAVMSIVEPRSDKREYLAALEDVRAALATQDEETGT